MTFDTGRKLCGRLLQVCGHAPRLGQCAGAAEAVGVIGRSEEAGAGWPTYLLLLACAIGPADGGAESAWCLPDRNVPGERSLWLQTLRDGGGRGVRGSGCYRAEIRTHLGRTFP